MPLQISDEAIRRRRYNDAFDSWLRKKHGFGLGDLAKDAVSAWRGRYEEWKHHRATLPSFKWQETPKLLESTAEAWKTALPTIGARLGPDLLWNQMKVGSEVIRFHYMTLHRHGKIHDGRYLTVQTEREDRGLDIWLLREADALRPSGSWDDLRGMLDELALLRVAGSNLTLWARQELIVYNG